MKIAVTEKNRDAIEAALKTVNGKSIQHAYSTIGDVLAVVETAQHRLDSILLKKDHKGAEVIAMSGVKCAKKYKGPRNVTSIHLVRSATGWFLTSIAQDTIWPDQSGFVRLGLTADQDKIAVEKFRSENYRTL